MKELYLAGGCFWGVQAYFDYQKGVINSVAGYAQGDLENPTYEQVCSGKTNHAETLKISYDPQLTSLEQILDEYFLIIDPTSLNKQGNDVGTQYRTGIYLTNKTDLLFVENYIKNLQHSFSKPIVVEVEMIKNFFNAEEYHQKYLIKNPNGYCHIDLSKFKK